MHMERRSDFIWHGASSERRKREIQLCEEETGLQLRKETNRIEKKSGKKHFGFLLICAKKVRFALVHFVPEFSRIE